MEKETLKCLRNILFKSFIINFVLIIAIWFFYLTGVYNILFGYFFGLNVIEVWILLVYTLGFWKILVAVFFLIPAVAIHWELKKHKK